jgi:hypothetical protein
LDFQIFLIDAQIQLPNITPKSSTLCHEKVLSQEDSKFVDLIPVTTFRSEMVLLSTYIGSSTINRALDINFRFKYLINQ